MANIAIYDVRFPEGDGGRVRDAEGVPLVFETRELAIQYLKDAGHDVDRFIIISVFEDEPDPTRYCTYMTGIGEWPFTNPPRCGEPAKWRLTLKSDPTEVGYSCVKHVGHANDGPDIWILTKVETA